MINILLAITSRSYNNWTRSKRESEEENDRYVKRRGGKWKSGSFAKIPDEVALEAFSRKTREEDSICPFPGAKTKNEPVFLIPRVKGRPSMMAGVCAKTDEKIERVTRR